MPSAAELSIHTNASAMEMAERMFGNGMKIESASYTGAKHASGLYENGNENAPHVTPGDTGVILSTGKAISFSNSGNDVNKKSSTSTNNRKDGDEELDELSGVKTYDAAVFEAEFTPQGDTLTMQVVFSSEEYLEYVGSGFNDAVGIWVNGEPATLTVGTGDITINNINDQSNSNLYVDNNHKDDLYNTEMDGFTVTLTLKAPVNADQVNTLKIAIADGGDAIYDSNLLIAGDSIQTALIAGDDAVDIDGLSISGVDVLANDSGGTLTITHINGTPVLAGDTVTLPTGEMVTLNSDGTFDIESDGDAETNVFTYTAADADGNTDTAFVTVTTTPCFVAGTLIDTPSGPRRVQDLAAGDWVTTRDNGPQQLRWVGQTRRQAIGADAPIVFAANSMGRHATVAFSPNHRIAVKSARAALLFETPEVLVKAAFLVDGKRITQRADGQPVTYVHLLFDTHQIIRSNGLDSESYHPAAETLNSFDAATRDEVLSLFPDIPVSGYGKTALPCLKSHEAKVLIA